MEVKITHDFKSKALEHGKNIPVRAFASDNFLSALNEAHSRVERMAEENRGNFDPILSQGLALLEEAIEENNRETFMEAANSFAEASEIIRTRPEPYFFLAYIFSVAGDKTTALKYYRAVEVIKPAYPGLGELKNEIMAKA